MTTMKCPACGHKDAHDYPGGVIGPCGLCDCTETYCDHGECVCTNKDRLIAELRQRIDGMEWRLTKRLVTIVKEPTE